MYKTAWEIPTNEWCENCAHQNSTNCSGMNCYTGISQKITEQKPKKVGPLQKLKALLFPALLMLMLIGCGNSQENSEILPLNLSENEIHGVELGTNYANFEDILLSDSLNIDTDFFGEEITQDFLDYSFKNSPAITPLMFFYEQNGTEQQVTFTFMSDKLLSVGYKIATHTYEEIAEYLQEVTGENGEETEQGLRFTSGDIIILLTVFEDDTINATFMMY